MNRATDFQQIPVAYTKTKKEEKKKEYFHQVMLMCSFLETKKKPSIASQF